MPQFWQKGVYNETVVVMLTSDLFSNHIRDLDPDLSLSSHTEYASCTCVTLLKKKNLAHPAFKRCRTMNPGLFYCCNSDGAKFLKSLQLTSGHSVRIKAFLFNKTPLTQAQASEGLPMMHLTLFSYSSFPSVCTHPIITA